MLVVLAALGVLLAGCGGGHARPAGQTSAATPPPVATQVRDELRAALRNRGTPPQPALPSIPGPRPGLLLDLPYSAVRACSGPAAGGAGAYTCATTPHGRNGVASVIVDVTSTGTWSMRQVPVHTTIRGRKVVAAAMVWGTGIRLRR